MRLPSLFNFQIFEGRTRNRYFVGKKFIFFEIKMMNFVAICLVFSTIFSGGIFNPSQQEDKKNNNLHHREDLVIKEANRVIMVEYEREARPKEDTKNYSPPSSSQQEQEPSVLDQKLSLEKSMASGVKNKLKEASSVLPNVGQGISYSSNEEGGGGGHHYNAKELICDAYGKCKHKIAGVFGKTKDGVSEKAKDVEEVGERAVGKMKDGLGKAKDAGEDAVEKAKERVFEKVREMEEAMERAGEKAKDGVGSVKEQGKETGEMTAVKTKEGLQRAKNSVYETGEMAKDGVGRATEQGKETGEMAMEKTKEGLGKVKESVSEKARKLNEKRKETGEKTIENVVSLGQDLKKGHNSIWDDRTVNEKWTGLVNEGAMNFSKIFHKGTDVFIDAAKHSVSKEVMNPTMGVLHLLGLATAYGISVWVTFLSSHVLAGALPRQQFGIVQSNIYPVYFRALVGSIGCALLAHVLRNPYWGFNSLQTYNMLASLGLVLLNLLYLEPLASKVMFDKLKLEKEEGRGGALEGEEFVEPTATIPTTATATTRIGTTETSTEFAGAPSATREEERDEVRSRVGELNRRLKSLNSVSSLLNVLTLMALTWQLVYLGRGLPVVS